MTSMKHPQTKAARIAANIKAIASYGCLAMCYLYCIGIGGTEYDCIGCVSDAMDAGLLDRECTVLDGAEFLNRFAGTGRFSVTKRPVRKLSEIREAAPVRFDWNGKSHWVVVERGKIVFDPIEDSICVRNGKPVTARIITLRRRTS